MLDSSVFKKLAHNDTGAAAGHQGGIVIPKAIAQFFPPLLAIGTAVSPTVDIRLNAELFVDGVRVGVVETRFQHQTWGGTRSPERRLTDNLGPIRSIATEDDILVFTKDLEDDSYIKLNLLRKGTVEYSKLSAKIGSLRWGAVDPTDPPVTVDQIKQADADLAVLALGPAIAFGGARATVQVSSVRKARDRAFRNLVLEQYDFRCAFTGRRFISPLSPKTIGLDAAHVVPVHANGSDHPANGLPLTKELHWAFDKGLIGVDGNRRIHVPPRVAVLSGNEFLRDLNGKALNEAKSAALKVLDDAFAWHRTYVLVS